MINRCIFCGDVCPDFSDTCDTCQYIYVDTFYETAEEFFGYKREEDEE